MFVKEKQYNNFIQKVKIDISKELNADECFIELKEMPTCDVILLTKTQQECPDNVYKVFKEILPKVICDHNLYETQTVKMTNEAVADLIYENVSLTLKVVKDYLNKVFFSQEKLPSDK